MFEPMGLIDEHLRWIESGMDPFWSGRLRAGPSPALDVWEDAERVIVEVELAGLDAEDVEVSAVGRRLSIRGERKARTAEGSEPHRRERDRGAFERILELAVDVLDDRVEASLESGVLRIVLPKAAAERPRRIEVKRSDRP
jgi:HSP20 family protein